MLTLRPNQHHLIEAIRRAIRQGNRRILAQAPTGFGKTVLATFMISRASKRMPCLFTVHRQELLDQSAATFDLMDIPYGFIASGYRPDPFQPVQVASIDTLKRRVGSLSPPGFIFVDEAHHVGAAGWARVMDAFPEAYIVGLSATPERLDGKGLDDQFDAMVCGPSVAELIASGDLADYRIFTPAGGGIQTEGIHRRMGDFKRDELDDAADKPTITGDAVKQYLRHARGERALAFCVSIKHSEHVAQKFREYGVPALHLDGNTPKEERRQATKAFRIGDVLVLCNVGLFGEGYDVPEAKALIDLAPTMSLAKQLQKWGRVLRINIDGSKSIILDHAGNWQRHGLPDDEREWSLEGKAGRAAAGGEADIAVRQCSECFAVHRPAPRCPECGYVYPEKPREVEHVEGELEEVDKETLRRQRVAKNIERWNCETREDFIALAEKNGYKNPRGWAHVQMQLKRKKKKPKMTRHEQQSRLEF